MKTRLLILLFCSSTIFSLAAASQKDGSDELKRLFGKLNSKIPDQEKILVNDSIRAIMESYIRSDSIFNHEFTGLKFLGQIKSEDSKMKVVSWNMLLRDSPARYFCYFINRRKDGNKILGLSADYSADNIRTDTVYTAENWYGALYYDMRPVKKGKDTFWMLLGIDYGNPAITRKVIDVLSFTPDDNPVFGKNWFYDGTNVKYREVLEYSFTAVISMRFMSDKLIVFDHLVPISPVHANNREFYGPDFSYDAYRFEKGIWQLKINVDARNEE
ncbi:MAG: hypothetical protein GYA41_01135 [Bacteroidales bacterium]|nr:hypothetical protein [Bacteroidales bacterium]